MFFGFRGGGGARTIQEPRRQCSEWRSNIRNPPLETSDALLDDRPHRHAVPRPFGLRLQHDPDAGRGHQGRLVRGRQPVPAPCGPDPEPGEHGQGLRGAGAGGVHRRGRGALPRDLDPGDAGDAERSRGAQEIPGRAGRAHECPEEPDRRQREVPGPQVGPEFPRPAGPARGHGEPHRRRAQPLHRDRADLQRHDPALPGEPHRDDVRLPREAELHRRERGGDLEAADGRLQYQARRARAAPGT